MSPFLAVSPDPRKGLEVGRAPGGPALQMLIDPVLNLIILKFHWILSWKCVKSKSSAAIHQSMCFAGPWLKDIGPCWFGSQAELLLE